VSKADVKGTAGRQEGDGRSVNQLPVTESKPYVCEPVPPAPFPDLLPVLDPLGGFIFWADEHKARAMLREKQVVILRRKTKIRGLQVIVDPNVMSIDQICSQNRFFGLPHRRDTHDNPARVWAQDRMGDTAAKRGTMYSLPNGRARWCRKVCMAVVTSCSITPKKAA
jgi:hypothetical protein